MRRNAPGWICILTMASIGSASAAGFDGSTPLICAVLETQQCEQNASCQNQTLENLDAPRFVHISVQDKKITGMRPSGNAIDAPIAFVKNSQDMMFLQGAQDAFAWSLVIGEADGRMALTIIDDEDSVVAFGECTPS